MGNQRSQFKENLHCQPLDAALISDMADKQPSSACALEVSLLHHDITALRTHLSTVHSVSDQVTLVNTRTSLHTLCRDYHACTPLAYSINTGSLEMVTLLLQAGADPQTKPCLVSPAPGTQHVPDIVSCLHLALVMQSDVRIVQLLVDRGAELGQLSGANVYPALSYAITCGEPALTDLLLTACQEHVNQRDRDGKTVVHHAVIQGKVKALSRLLELGADCNKADVLGRTPLMYALKQDRVKCVSMLVQQGASCNAVDKRNRTALHYAIPCAFGLTEETEGIPLSDANKAKKATILEQFWPHMSISVKFEVGEFQKIAVWAVECVRAAVVVDILQKNVHFLQLKCPKGDTLLHKAAKHNRPEIIQYLTAEHNFPANQLNQEGWTPLMYAALAGGRHCMTLLIKQGADPDFRSADGWTVLWCLLTSGHQDLAVYYVRQGCRLLDQLPLRMLQGITSIQIPKTLLGQGKLLVSPLEYAVHNHQEKVAAIMMQSQIPRPAGCQASLTGLCTLKELSRHAVRKAMGFGVLDNVHRLDLESGLRLYLTLG